MATAPDILDDLFHHCALWAWFEIYEETGQWPPDSELTRRRAYDLYETEKRKEALMKRKTIDIHELLAERRQIALIWSTDDVQELRPDLSDDQCWEVLQDVDRHKDAELGITWLTLELAAKHLFGSAPETDEAEEA
jgi:hypothetical protein